MTIDEARERIWHLWRTFPVLHAKTMVGAIAQELVTAEQAATLAATERIRAALRAEVERLRAEKMYNWQSKSNALLRFADNL